MAVPSSRALGMSGDEKLPAASSHNETTSLLCVLCSLSLLLGTVQPSEITSLASIPLLSFALIYFLAGWTLSPIKQQKMIG